MRTTVHTAFPLGLLGEYMRQAPVCMWECTGQVLPSGGHSATPTSLCYEGVALGSNYGMILRRLALEVWWRPHQGLSLSDTTEKSFRASLPQPQIP